MWFCMPVGNKKTDARSLEVNKEDFVIVSFLLLVFRMMGAVINIMINVFMTLLRAFCVGVL